MYIYIYIYVSYRRPAGPGALDPHFGPGGLEPREEGRAMYIICMYAYRYLMCVYVYICIYIYIYIYIHTLRILLK